MWELLDVLEEVHISTGSAQLPLLHCRKNSKSPQCNKLMYAGGWGWGGEGGLSAESTASWSNPSPPTPTILLNIVLLPHNSRGTNLQFLEPKIKLHEHTRQKILLLRNIFPSLYNISVWNGSPAGFRVQGRVLLFWSSSQGETNMLGFPIWLLCRCFPTCIYQISACLPFFLYVCLFVYECIHWWSQVSFSPIKFKLSCHELSLTGTTIRIICQHQYF